MSAENIGRSLGVAWAKSGLFLKTLFFILIAALVTMCASPNQSEPSQKQSAIAPSLSDPAIEAAKIAKKVKEEAAFQKTAVFAASIKKALRDPDSLVWEGMRANDDATIICIEYRARNGFGGMNREFAVYANRKVSQKVPSWNKYCTQPLNDMKHVKYAIN